MKKLITSLVLGAAMIGSTVTPALARDKHDRHEQRYEQRYDRWQGRDVRYDNRYRNQRDYYRDARARGWSDRNGRYYGNNYRCGRDSDAEGTAIGAIGGGVLGNVIAPNGNKTVGTIAGAALGGLIGNRIDHGEGNRRC